MQTPYEPLPRTELRPLSGRVALVTGSTSGIGLGVATVLAAKGATILLNGFGDRAEIDREVARLAETHGVSVGYSAADMSSPDAIALPLAGVDAIRLHHLFQQAHLVVGVEDREIAV